MTLSKFSADEQNKMVFGTPDSSDDEECQIDEERSTPPPQSRSPSPQPRAQKAKPKITIKPKKVTPKTEPVDAPPVEAPQPNLLPDISDFLTEVQALSPQFDHKDTLRQCKLVAAQTHKGVAEWRVKQFRLWLSGVETGLLQEVTESLKGKLTMGRRALEFYDMMVTLTNKAAKSNRNSRCPMAMNGRLSAKGFEALAKSRDVVPAALIHAQEIYAFENYEKANALALNPSTTDEALKKFMDEEFCGGWFSTAAGQTALDEGTEIFGSRTKARAPRTVQPPTPAQLANALASDPAALAEMIATLQKVQEARDTSTPPDVE